MKGYKSLAGSISLTWSSDNIRRKYEPSLANVLFPLASIAWSRLRLFSSLKYAAERYLTTKVVQ